MKYLWYFSIILGGVSIIMNKISQKKSAKRDRRGCFRADFIRRLRGEILGLYSLEGFTQNISESGLCLLLNEELSPGIIIKVEFNLPLNEIRHIKAYAQVVWQKDFLTGAKFVV